MTEFDPTSSSSELVPLKLRYSTGWQEILEAPDAIDYQIWLNDLTELTQRTLINEGIEWAHDREAVAISWQVALEQVADIVINPEEIDNMTPAEIVETALMTLKLNLESIDWDEEGLVFTVPNMFSGEEATIDLRELPTHR